MYLLAIYYYTVALRNSQVRKKVLAEEKLANHELFSSPIFTDTPKMYLAFALTLVYSPNFSLPMALTCMVYLPRVYKVYIDTVL